MTRAGWTGMAAALVAAGALGAGCASSPCGAGTRDQGGTCVPDCAAGTEADPRGAGCVPACAAGMRRDSATGACLPESARCTSGQVWDGARCLPVSQVCAEETTWVASRGRCVPDVDLLAPDVREGTDLNDYGEIPDACGRLTLPAPGAVLSIGGRVDPPRDLALVLLPDTDCWKVETTGPTLLRVRLDGLGGASPALRVLRDDTGLYVERHAFGTTDAEVTRDLFLARAGTWTLVVGDVVNLHGRGAWVGGGKMGYRLDLSVRTPPEPERLGAAEGAPTSGTWPRTPPADGSQVRFYRMSVDEMALYLVGVRSSDAAVQPVLVTLGPDGAAAEADWAHQPAPSLFAAAGDATLVVDFERWHAARDTGFALEVERLPVRTFESELTDTVEQPAWSVGTPMPSTYWAFRADKGQIVTAHVSSTTGFTCFQIWDPRFEQLQNDVQCMLSSAALYRHPLRFEARYTGWYVVQFVDWSEGVIERSFLWAVPARTFDASVEVHRQAPRPLGDLPAPHQALQTVTVDEWERFYALTPQTGQAFRFTTAGAGTFAPRTLFYRLGGWTPALFPDWYSDEPDFVFRSVDGTPLLFGVADDDGEAGAFELLVRRVVPPTAGSLSAAHAVSATLEVAAGERSALLQLDVREAGLMRLTAAAAADTGLLPRGPDLRPVRALERNEAGPGAPEVLELPVPVAPFFLDVTLAGGGPAAADVPFTLGATLEPYAREQERNDSQEAAQALAVPATVAAAIVDPQDADWYRFDAAGSDVLDIVTRGMGAGLEGGTMVRLFHSSGRMLAKNAGGAGGRYGALRGFAIPQAGTYYVQVLGGGIAPAYLLEVKHASR